MGKNLKSLAFLAASGLFMALLAGCPVQPASSSSSSSSSVVSSSSSLSSSSSAFVPIIAINEPFTNSAGSFYLDHGNLTTPDGSNAITGDGTIVTLGGSSGCLIDAYETNQNGSKGVEAQWNLLQPTYMTNQDFVINFDVYVPSASFANLTGIQFALFQSPALNSANTWYPIYSGYYKSTISADTWCHISAAISTTSGAITYSAFPSGGDPTDWYFDKVRVQFVAPDNGEEIKFAVANLVISNTN